MRLFDMTKSGLAGLIALAGLVLLTVAAPPASAGTTDKPGTPTTVLGNGDASTRNSLGPETELGGEPEILTVPYVGDPKLPPRVNVMPGKFIGGTEPFTWRGRNMVVWGNVKNGTIPLTYEWQFGDGTSAATGTVSNARYIATNHTYATAGIKRAVLTVTDADGFSDRDTVIIDVQSDSTLQWAINAAIQDGLRYLYNTQHPTLGYWDYGTYDAGATAQAVLCFENQGYLPGDNWEKSIYSEYVQLGLDFITSRLVAQSIGIQTYCNPEQDAQGNTDHNGLGLHPNSDRTTYEVGMVMMAIVGSDEPDHVALTGPVNVIGRTYYDIIVDLVDWVAWAQNESGTGRGGWRYGPNYGDADNSVSQWPALGLMAAEREWSIFPPPCVCTELNRWTTVSQRSDGLFYYQPNGWAYGYMAVTGAGLAQLSHCAWPVSDPKVKRAMQALRNQWASGYHKGFPYAMYAVKKACELALPDPIIDLDTTAVIFDWYTDYVNFILPLQNHSTGAFPMSYWGIYDHEWYVLVLQPVICRPQADIAAPDTVGVLQPFQLDASASSHACGEILEWRWDFDINDADGIDFDNPDAVGQVVTHPGVALPPGVLDSSITVGLRVFDDNEPVLTGDAQKSVIIYRGCKAPVAIIGGPYAGHPGESIPFDGCDSYDPDAIDPESACEDSIVSYAWDFNGDGVFNDYADSTVCTAAYTWPAPHEGYVCLEVKDSYGRTDTVCTTIDISPVDLDLQAEDISFSPPYATEDDTLTISAYVFFSAEFDTTIHNVRVRFYNGDPNVVVDQIGEDQIIPSIDSGQSLLLEVTWEVPDTLCHQIYVVIDPIDEISEWNETNNSAHVRWCPNVCGEGLIVLPPIQYHFYAHYIGPIQIDQELCFEWADTCWQLDMTIDPFHAWMWVGNFSPDEMALEVNTSSVMINEEIQPESCTVVPYVEPESMPVWVGTSVLRLRYSVPELVQYYIDTWEDQGLLLWDTTLVRCTVSGLFNDGSPWETCVMIPLISHRSGDVNRDTRVDISDLTFLISYLFRGGQTPVPLSAGDVDHDGRNSVSDITRLVTILFR